MSDDGLGSPANTKKKPIKKAVANDSDLDLNANNFSKSDLEQDAPCKTTKMTLDSGSESERNYTHKRASTVVGTFSNLSLTWLI